MKTKRLMVEWIDEHDKVIATHDQYFHPETEREKADVIGAFRMKYHKPASSWRLRVVNIWI